MKYKPGDKVRVRADLNPNNDYGGILPVLSMCMERGNIVTIKNGEVCDGLKAYHVEGDTCNFFWTEEMFEETADKEKAGAGMKYKVGDKVKIRHDLHVMGNWCGSDVAVVKDMLKMAGKLATIKKVRRNDRYDIEEDGGCWIWHESMIQGKAIPVRIGVSEGKVDIKAEEPLQEKVAEVFGCERKEVPNDYAIAGEPTLANDAVSHPSHYTDGRIECIDFIQDKKLDFARGNVVKYICRAGKKGGGKAKEIEDLKKAKQYCEFAIRDLEGRV